jgi:hypothetical protein
MYKYLGWFNVALLIYSLTLYFLRLINKKLKSKSLKDILKMTRKYRIWIVTYSSSKIMANIRSKTMVKLMISIFVWNFSKQIFGNI